jgi:hypothetical protein
MHNKGSLGTFHPLFIVKGPGPPCGPLQVVAHMNYMRETSRALSLLPIGTGCPCALRCRGDGAM